MLEVQDDLGVEFTQAARIELLLDLEAENNLRIGLSLLVRFTHPVKEWMIESLIDADTEVWVHLQHAVEQVDTLSVGAWILGSHVHTLDRLKAFQVGYSFGISDEGDVLVVGSPQNVENDCELVIAGDREPVVLDTSVAIRTQREAGPAWEERLTIQVGRCALLHHAEQLSKDAAYRPHVDGLTVVFLEKNELRSSVPARHDVTCELSLHILAKLLRGLELLHKLCLAIDDSWLSILLFLVG